MLREFTERTMSLGPGEQHFSPEMRDAFFKVGLKPPQYDEKVDRATVRWIRGGEADKFAVVLDLVRIERESKRMVRSLVETSRFEDQSAAEVLVEDMNDPRNLARANRVLLRSSDVRDKAIVAGVAVALGAATVVLHL